MKINNLLTREILYLQSDINYTEFHLVDGSKKVSSYHLKFYQESKETKHFLRVNHSVLVNPEYIDNFGKKNHDWIITLTNGKEIKASRRKAKIIKELDIKQLRA